MVNIQSKTSRQMPKTPTKTTTASAAKGGRRTSVTPKQVRPIPQKTGPVKRTAQVTRDSGEIYAKPNKKK